MRPILAAAAVLALLTGTAAAKTTAEPGWQILQDDGTCRVLPGTPNQLRAEAKRRHQEGAMAPNEFGGLNFRPIHNSGSAAFEPVELYPSLKACTARARQGAY